MKALSNMGLALVARTRATPLITSSPAIGSYADRLTSVDVEHGTLAGFEAGCRAELSCPARRAGGLSCLALRIRLAGDWQFARLVAAGATPVEAARAIAALDARNRRATRPARRRSRASVGNHPVEGGEALRSPRVAADEVAA